MFLFLFSTSLKAECSSLSSFLLLSFYSGFPLLDRQPSWNHSFRAVNDSAGYLNLDHCPTGDLSSLLLLVCMLCISCTLCLCVCLSVLFLYLCNLSSFQLSMVKRRLGPSHLKMPEAGQPFLIPGHHISIFCPFGITDRHAKRSLMHNGSFGICG